MSRHARKSLAKGKRPKAKLGLPDLDHSKSPVLDSLRSRESKRGCAIDELFSGTVLNLACRSAKWSSRDSVSFWKIEISPQARSTGGWLQFEHFRTILNRCRRAIEWRYVHCIYTKIASKLIARRVAVSSEDILQDDNGRSGVPTIVCA